MTKNTQNKSKSKKITIDDLARMVARGFSSMEERFDTKIDTLEQKMNDKFDQVDKRFDEVDKRFDRLEDKYGRRLDTLESRTITLKNHMENGFKKKLAW